MRPRVPASLVFPLEAPGLSLRIRPAAALVPRLWGVVGREERGPSLQALVVQSSAFLTNELELGAQAALSHSYCGIPTTPFRHSCNS